MLSHQELTRYLLLKQLIRADAIVDGDLRMIECSRRNHNFKVVNAPGTSYFIKCGLGFDKSESVAHEAAVYQLLQGLPEASVLSRYLPQFVQFDSDEHLLIVELLTGAQDFREYHLKGHFSTALATELGRAMSTLHRAQLSDPRTPMDGHLTARVPWILSLHRPTLDVFREASSGNLQLIRIVQNSGGFGLVLDRLREDWRADGLVHNDIKWDNCLVLRDPGTRKKPTVKIVDWEFAGCGDRCWDAGAIFSNYLSVWLLSIPISGEEPPEQFLELARYPLGKMQPALRAYWRAYVQGLGLNPAEANVWLMRAVRYAGARLIQTSFEQLQFSTQLTGNLVCMLQLSLNIITRPHEAAVHLLGIPGNS